MDFNIDFLNVGDGDAIIIWARDAQSQSDFIFFLDGGDTGNGDKIVNHYNMWIKPNLYPKKYIGFINSHPHTDHINGLIEIVEILRSDLNFSVYNDPVECITEEHLQRIKKAYIDGEDPDITHLYESFEQVAKLNALCKKYNIVKYKGLANANTWLNGKFKILSPAEPFYINYVQYFTDIDFLKSVDLSKKALSAPITTEEEALPCKIVDEQSDTSPENLTSIVIELIASDGRRYLLTSDAGVEAFDYMASEGFTTENLTMVQLPHHGSRRNISSEWIKRFGANNFIASAAGNVKHPRKAVINCIKRNLKNASVYSTHQNGYCLSECTNPLIFPNRGWMPAIAL